ncbi:MAG: glycyl-radical enzyme activating protein [Deltaproteobacteria bacterium]|nr:glycyl-radical enzyme activating protein [Deltaproteobacteria bacterium]
MTASPTANLTTTRPLVFDIKRHALEDGPGIRSTVFFKGCPLTCLWCQNPESIDPGPEIGFYPRDCIKCGDCVQACPVSACALEDPFLIDRKRCTMCGDCVEACPGRALRLIGRFYPVDELVDILLRDKIFYEVSGGGVTFSGGEPTVFMDYAAAVLKALKDSGIHTAIQTNGFFAWEEFGEKILPYVDLIMFDVKLADADKHREYTGQSNELILANLKNLLSEIRRGVSETRRGGDEREEAVLPRIPLIPEFTATVENLRSISDLLKGLGVKKCSLLPYNPTWISKAENFGKNVDPRLSRYLLTPQELKKYQDIFSWPVCVQRTGRSELVTS